LLFVELKIHFAGLNKNMHYVCPCRKLLWIFPTSSPCRELLCIMLLHFKPAGSSYALCLPATPAVNSYANHQLARQNEIKSDNIQSDILSPTKFILVPKK
jgi:hypothetical protein